MAATTGSSLGMITSSQGGHRIPGRPVVLQIRFGLQKRRPWEPEVGLECGRPEGGPKSRCRGPRRANREVAVQARAVGQRWPEKPIVGMVFAIFDLVDGPRKRQRLENAPVSAPPVEGPPVFQHVFEPLAKGVRNL